MLKLTVADFEDFVATLERHRPGFVAAELVRLPEPDAAPILSAGFAVADFERHGVAQVCTEQTGSVETYWGALRLACQRLKIPIYKGRLSVLL